MLRYSITQLQNGKWYGELVWGRPDKTLNVDVVSVDRNTMERDFTKGTRIAVQLKIREFLNWSFNTISKAGRDMWADTQLHMNAVGIMASKLDYVNLSSAVRLLNENMHHLEALKPKVSNYLWIEMEELMYWAKAMHYDVSAPCIEINPLLRANG